MLRNKLSVIVVLLALIILLGGGCATPTPELVEKEVTKVVKETIVEKETVVQKETVVEKETVVQKETVVEEVVITATPEPTPGPATGGTLVIALGSDPDTLDPHKTGSAVSSQVMDFLGASLIARDPDGNYVPYLAERWEVSEDGLTWDFTLKEGVKFHDGTPFTAHDYAWTFQRILDPKTLAALAKSMLGTVVAAEALDDYTLRLTLSAPFFPLLPSLTAASYLMPLSQAAVEQWGDEYGRHPLSVGPYKLKEWLTGEKVVLERNPDYDWGPEFAHQGPWYFDTIECLTIPEYSTIIAGLEAGEIDYAQLQAKDVERMRETGQFQIFEPLLKGAAPYVALNVSKPPFDDIRVRKAFSLAVNREALINAVEGGNAIVQYGPLSSSVTGYWPGVEYIGYGYDLEKAKALMVEAGYVYNSDGMLEKDGQPFALTLKTRSAIEYMVKAAEILQEQYKALGVDIEIEMQEYGVNVMDVALDRYQISVFRYMGDEADILHMFYHSSMIGAGNLPQVNDPELDEILDKTRSTTDPEKRQEWVNEAQRRIVEQAYMVPLYTPKVFVALNNRVTGAVFSPATATLYLNDAYFETEP